MKTKSLFEDKKEKRGKKLLCRNCQIAQCMYTKQIQYFCTKHFHAGQNNLCKIKKIFVCSNATINTHIKVLNRK